MSDVLTDWIRVSRSHGVVLARNLLPAGWGITMEARAATVVHAIVRGSAWLLRDGQPPLRLDEGALVLVPRGVEHALVDDPSVTPTPLAHVVAKPEAYFKGPSTTTLVCGEYRSDTQVDAAMLHALPDIVHFTHEEVTQESAMAATLSLLLGELEVPRTGSDTAARHLLDALFVYVLRAWGATRACERGWLSGLNDPAVARALTRMHEQPALAWTVESLARVAHLSRAAFARRFAERLGEPPMEYLTRWRMTLASRMLADGDVSVSQVAQRVGYTSEFAFSRAFKRSRGLAPMYFRRELSG